MSFLSSLFLLGLGAAVLPILIHLLSRQRARRVEFGSIDFIRRLEEKRRRRFRLTQLLLLLLRVLLLLLIALGFARPTFRRALFGVGGGGETAAVIVLDASASMGAEDGGESRFEAARRRALGVAGLLREDDESALLLASTVASRTAAGLTGSRDHLRGEIEGATVTAGATDLAGSLRAAVRLLSDARSPNRELYIISEFQRNAVAQSGALASLPENTRAYILPVAPARGGNAAVTAVHWQEERLGTGAVRVEAEVSRFGGEGTIETIATLSVGGEESERRLVSLQPGERQSVVFTTTLKARGHHAAAVSIDSPDLAADNTRPFVIGLADGIPVLVVDGRAERDRASGYHVARALAPLPDAESFFHVTSVASASGGLPDLAPYSAVVLAEVGRLATDEVGRLAAFLDRGGGILVLPGRTLDANFYNKDLLPRLGVPIRFETTPTEFSGSFARVDEVAEGHAVFAPFGEHQDRLLRDTKVFRFFPAQIDPGARAVAQFGGGAPAILEADRGGAGRIVLTTFPADPQWTTFPRDPAFLPFLHETMKYLSRTESPEDVNVVVGQPFRRVVRELRVGGEVVAIRPDGREALVNPESDPAGLLLEVRDTEIPGIYTLRSPAEEFPFAAAIDPNESDLAVLGRAEIEEAVPGAEFVPPDAEIRRAVLAARFGKEYWREVLLFALIVAIAEAILGRGGFPVAASQSRERRAA